MIQILDNVAASFHSSFTPKSPEEYFALRLARALEETEAAAHYAILISQHSHQQVIQAYKRAKQSGAGAARAFHKILTQTKAAPDATRFQDRILSIRLTRRFLCVAVFKGTEPEGWRMRQLSSDQAEAEAATEAFLQEVLAEHPCTGAAIESAQDDNKRLFLQQAAVKHLRLLGLRIYEVDESAMFSAFAQPAPKTRKEVRQITHVMWPLENDSKAQASPLDAYALGLYIQTERLF